MDDRLLGSIVYLPPPKYNDKAVHEFIGPQPPCDICGSEYGTKACPPCNSRIIYFVDGNGEWVGADEGATIEKRESGLYLKQDAEFVVFFYSRERDQVCHVIRTGVDCHVVARAMCDELGEDGTGVLCYPASVLNELLL